MTRRIVISLFAALSVSLAVFTAQANAAKPAPLTPVGNDVSYPQCRKSLPSNHAFGIVGVNGGKATVINPCLVSELTWASNAKGGTTQPLVQVYVNTANPGEVIDQVTTWPTSSTAGNPYGDCHGGNDMPCSWQYGYNRAVDQVNNMFVPAARSANIDSNPGSYTWWLDVETMNTWQSGSNEALQRNAASLEGMTAYFQSRDGKVGIYSTGFQWGTIAGPGVSDGSNLNGLDSWLAGARDLKTAKTYCAKPPLTQNGHVTLAQYISNNLDYDYSCVL